MSEVAKATIAAELALLTQIVDFPVEPFDYGSDISGDFDVDPNADEVSGRTTLSLAQAIVRRLDCPRGQLPDDPNYGIALRSYANKGTTAREVRQLGGQIRAEVLKDDRVESLTVTVRPSSTGQTLTIELAIVPIDSAIGGFSLTLSASSSAVLLEEIRAAA